MHTVAHAVVVEMHSPPGSANIDGPSLPHEPRSSAACVARRLLPSLLGWRPGGPPSPCRSVASCCRTLSRPAHLLTIGGGGVPAHSACVQVETVEVELRLSALDCPTQPVEAGGDITDWSEPIMRCGRMWLS